MSEKIAGGVLVVKQKKLLEAVQISKSTLWRWIAAGQFPKPIKLGERSSAWMISDVEEWLRKREGKAA